MIVLCLRCMERFDTPRVVGDLVSCPRCGVWSTIELLPVPVLSEWEEGEADEKVVDLGAKQ